MIVSISYFDNNEHIAYNDIQLSGIFVGIFACGVPVYFLNPKVSSTYPGSNSGLTED